MQNPWKTNVRIISLASLLIFVLAGSWAAGQQNSSMEQLYNCPMHPDYFATKPGTCPICGMRLVPVSKERSHQEVRQERIPVEIGPEQQRILGLALSEVKIMPMERGIRALGHISLAPPSQMPAPIEGNVGEIYQNPGPAGALRLKSGDPILSLSAPSGTVIVRATGPLVLISVPQPGDRVEKGKDLCRIIGLSTIFVLADFRSTDIPFIRGGLEGRAILPAYPGRVWQGTVVEASQQFDERLQTLKVKLQFQNDLAEIWQGMQANIELASPIGSVVAVPESAVIADGEDPVVFVAQPGNIFEPRKIETGLRTNLFAEVRRGLSPGERVVTSATFLLDSESRLRALVRTVNRR
jgi:Cu(I)/Ag(I) efflux system membrane fusion protein